MRKFNVMVLFLFTVTWLMGFSGEQTKEPQAADDLKFQALTASSLRVAPQHIPPADVQKLARFEHQLERLRQLLKIPGLSAAVVKDHKILWAKGYGYADLENKIKASENTPYRLGSVSKIFTATILMQLVEAGKIDLDEPMANYGVYIKSPGIIKLKHILNHTSEGFPGHEFKYNGSRFAALGTPIRKVIGKPFREILIENIIKPLGLSHTAPYPSSWDKFFKSVGLCKKEKELDHVLAELAKPYTLDTSLNIIRGAYVGSFNPGAGLMSSVIDLATFNIAIDKNLLLKKETQELAWTAPVSPDGATLPYGGGWFIREYMEHRFITHYGACECVAALIVKAPDKNMTFIVLANSRNLNLFFDTYYCDPQDHLAGLLFLKIFIFEFMEQVPDIDWEAPEDEIVKKLEKVQDIKLKEILKRELILNYILFDRFRKGENSERLINVYARLYSTTHLKDSKNWTVITQIKDVEDNQHQTKDFTLDKDKTVCIYAVGESDRQRMFDYGYIEKTATGEIVWEMLLPETRHAGGALKNREIRRVISLPAGQYRLHYLTDDSHAINQWNDLPPNHRFWGITLYHDPSAVKKGLSTRVQQKGNPSEPEEWTPGPLLTPLQTIIWVSCELLFLSALALFPAYGIRRFRSWISKGKYTYTPADARISAKIARFMAFFTGLAYYLLVKSNLGSILDGFIESHDCFTLLGDKNTLLWKGMLLLMVVLVIFTVLAWKQKYWCLKRRAHFTSITLASVILVLFLFHWNAL